jgi:tetratricopeptide (TPR) repeat protein
MADAEAADLYRSGLYEWQTRTPAGLKRAIDDLTQAIVRDPGFAEAYAGLAVAYNLDREFSDMPAADAYARMRAAALRAIALNPSLGSAHAALGFVDFYWLQQLPAARKEFERAAALAPPRSAGTQMVRHVSCRNRRKFGRHAGNRHGAAA